jgi:predicted nucleic acid-binding protein
MIPQSPPRRLAAGCETLLSEVMPDGLRINGRLRIANPFRAAD